MKKFILAAAVAGAALASGSASADLVNYSVVLGGTSVNAGSYLNFDSVGYNVITPTTLTTFSFVEQAALHITSTGPFGANLTAATGYELTGVLNGYGSGTVGGSVNFSGGTLDLYAQQLGGGALGYGTPDGAGGFLFGANDGLKIATLQVTSGTVNPLSSGAYTPIDNATVTLSLTFTDLLAGYFFTAGGDDLATILLANPLVFSFVTGNASLLNPAVAPALVSEFGANFGQSAPPSFFTATGGQIKLDVPEPGSLALVGVALAGLGLSRRRKAA